jgi:hypothetical protein
MRSAISSAGGVTAAPPPQRDPHLYQNRLPITAPLAHAHRPPPGGYALTRYAYKWPTDSVAKMSPQKFDLAVVVVGGFAVAPGAVDLDVLLERVLGDCHRAGFLSSCNTGRRAFLGAI